MSVVPGRMRKNATGVILEVDDLVLDVLGFSREDLIGRRSTEFMHPDDHEQALSAWVRMLSEPTMPSTIQVRHRNAAERWLWVESVNTVEPGGGGTVLTEMVLIDRPADDRTSVSSHLLRRLAEALPFGIAQIDAEHRVVYSNRKLADVLGRSDGASLFELLPLLAGERAPLEEALASVLAGTDSEIEVSIAHPRLGTRRCGVILSALAGRSGYGTTGALLCITDITDQRQVTDEILHRASHDALTGCLNRAAVFEALGASVRACADGAGVAVLFLDLDHFKRVNDTHGHAAGDHLLRTVAERLAANSRDACVGRLGGDEFLVVARNVPTAAHAEQLGKRLSRAVRRPLRLGGGATRPGASVGVAWTDDPALDPAELVIRSDMAMYAAKRRRHGVASRTGAGDDR